MDDKNVDQIEPSPQRLSLPSDLTSNKIIPIFKVNEHYLIDRQDLIYAKGLDIVFGQHIGEGSFGDVYYAKYQSNLVALKITYYSSYEIPRINSEKAVLNVLKVSVQILSSYLLMESINSSELFTRKHRQILGNFRK